MPEQFKASSAFIGSMHKNIALVTDGRYSGASHGFIVGHVVPEAAGNFFHPSPHYDPKRSLSLVGGPIALVKDGDMITISAKTNSIHMNVSDEELAARKKLWKAPKSLVNRGVLAKYQALVGDASHGAMTDLF